MNLAPLKREIDQIAKDKGIDKKMIIEALEEAMRQAAKQEVRPGSRDRGPLQRGVGEIELFEFREVVDRVTDPNTQITLDQRARVRRRGRDRRRDRREARRERLRPHPRAGGEAGDHPARPRRRARHRVRGVQGPAGRDRERHRAPLREGRDRRRPRPRRGRASAQGADAARDLSPRRPDPRLREGDPPRQQGPADRALARRGRHADEALRAGSARDVRGHRHDRVGGPRAGRALEDRGGLARLATSTRSAPASA